MFGEVTSQAIMWKMVAGVFGVIIPIVILLIWKKKTGRSIKPALAGAVIFFVFTQIFEGIPKLIFFTANTALADYVWTHTWAYTLIGCLQAGIFEEIGRYVAFRFFLKKHQDRRDSITYGIGHGGFEAILILGVAGLTSIGMAAAINSGSIEQGFAALSLGQQKTVALQATTLVNYGFARMLIDVLERLLAMTLHISLSVVVFYSVREKKLVYLLLAIILHAVFDIPAALYQCGVIGIVVSEAGLFICLAAIMLYAVSIYKKMKRE